MTPIGSLYMHPYAPAARKAATRPPKRPPTPRARAARIKARNRAHEKERAVFAAALEWARYPVSDLAVARFRQALNEWRVAVNALQARQRREEQGT